MSFFKKTAACLAAAAVMASVAATASAEFKVEGNPQVDSDKYSLTVWGIPEEAFDYPSFQMQFLLDDDRSKFLVLSGYLGGALCDATISVVDEDSNYLHIMSEMPAQRAFDLGTQKSVFHIEFDKDDEYLAEMMTWTGVECMLTVYTDVDTMLWLDSDGNVLGDEAKEEYPQNVALDLKALSSSSEPTSSEPVSEPESEPESSEPTAAPSNVDTGTAGVAAVIGTAMLAAGAVVVARKRR